MLYVCNFIGTVFLAFVINDLRLVIVLGIIQFILQIASYERGVKDALEFIQNQNDTN